MDNKVILVSDKSVKGKILNIGAVGPGGDKAPGCWPSFILTENTGRMTPDMFKCDAQNENVCPLVCGFVWIPFWFYGLRDFLAVLRRKLLFYEFRKTSQKNNSQILNFMQYVTEKVITLPLPKLS